MIRVAGAIFAACWSVSAAVVHADEPFRRAAFDTAPDRRQTVVSGFFSNEPVAGIAVVGRRDDGGCHATFYGFGDDRWSGRTTIGLPGNTAFVDVIRSADRDRVVFYATGRVAAIEPADGMHRELARMDVDFVAASDGAVPRLDIGRDLNDDGLDDLVIPGVDGFAIAIQLPDGRFAEPVRLGPPEPYRHERGFDAAGPYGEIGMTAETLPWYLGRIHRFDVDRDGLMDLAFWNESHFDVHRQWPDGRFDPDPTPLYTALEFDADGLYALQFAFPATSRFALMTGLRKKTVGTFLHTIVDLDNDGIADAVTHTVKGRSVLRMRGRFAVHYGVQKLDGIDFERTPAVVLEPPGTSAGLAPWGYASYEFRDLDGDGQVELAYGSVRTGLGGMVRVLAAGSVRIDVGAFRIGRAAGTIRPAVAGSIRTRSEPLDRRGSPFFPPVLLGDVNGDGRTDLVAGKHRRELRISPGLTDSLGFAPPISVAVEMPSDERRTTLVRLDRDGRDDIVIHHPPKEGPGRVVTLFSR